MNIFEKSLQFSHFIAVSMAVVLMCGISSANAASNGCDVEDNTYVNAELALCNTHVYNIGDVTNPKTDSDKQLMRDVVALKTTVMTQQMYKQYEYMDAMIRRFKTQLKKAVLTTSLQAAGAADENGNTGGYSSSGSGGGGYYNTAQRNMYVAGTDNCNNKSTTLDVFTCLRSNYNTIYTLASGGTNISSEVRQQVAADFAIMKNNSNSGTVPAVSVDGTEINCTSQKELGTRKKLTACLDALNAGIRKGYEDALNKQAQQTKKP